MEGELVGNRKRCFEVFSFLVTSDITCTILIMTVLGVSWFLFFCWPVHPRVVATTRNVSHLTVFLLVLPSSSSWQELISQIRGSVAGLFELRSHRISVEGLALVPTAAIFAFIANGSQELRAIPNTTLPLLL